ncbi:MAG: hypothetical protein FWH21_04280 [Kiritimatiellaeota bacterium]|nr:hypothetical protein [Kiritimatiellota bacterium]
MKNVLFVFAAAGMAAAAVGQMSRLNPITNPTLEELRKNFAQPGRNFSSGPLWTWNDLLTEEQVRSTLRDLAAQHVKQVWVHPRPGLMTPYLSDDWFRLWKVSLDEAEKLDMNVWIYDENSYPSGFAGGFVPEALPDSRGMGLKFAEVEKLDTIGTDLWYVFDPAHQNITETAKRDGKLPPLENGQRYLIASVQHTPQNGWFGGKWYVDLLKKGVTEKFIEITHEAYAKNIGDQFGKRVLGIFTDEPHPAGSYLGTWVSWNSEIPKRFEEKFGYSLIDHLPSLHKPVGDWKKVRYQYHQLMLDLFVERWAMPNFAWCEAHGLEWTGHYWEHGWPGTSHGPDNMAMYIWHQRPAIDLLMNTYDGNSPNAQFGNVRSGKELASIVNQMGRSRTLSENYGAGGWDIRFEDLKRLGDWSYAVGVNTLNEHLSYVTIRGARKRDHPQSFSYHTPWFEGYHVLADYFTRLSYVLSQGRQVNRIVVIEPTTTAWMYQGEAHLAEIGQSFTRFVNALEHAQVEYDLASEDTIARFGKSEGKTFSINLGEYDMVILPPNTENLNRRTAELLTRYAKDGGTLLCAGDWPTRLDGVACPPMELGKQVPVEDAVAAAVRRTAADGLTLNIPNGTTSVFHHRRRLPDCEILFVCNTDLANPVKVEVIATKTHGAMWFLGSGGVTALPPFEKDGGILLPLPPSGSCLLVYADKPQQGSDGFEQWTTFGGWTTAATVPGSETAVTRLDPNVLTLDFIDVTVGGETRKEQYAWKANRWIFEKHGMGANPWDNGVQFKDELITKTFPENSGFEAVYRFTLEGNVPENLAIVIERADLYTVFCNGTELKPEPGAWWLDKAFGKMDVSKTARPGENEIRIAARPMTIWHELESAYLIGDFSLRPAEKGFVVCPPQPLALNTAGEGEQGWHRQGMPFYAGKVGYSRSFDVQQADGTFAVKLPDSPAGWHGASARVFVNGNDAGFTISAPWVTDVSQFVKAGRNEVTVHIYGTPKNLLGPHHAGKLRGSAWPGSFQKGPDAQPAGNAYDVIGYGLFEPFELIMATPKQKD